MGDTPKPPAGRSPAPPRFKSIWAALLIIPLLALGGAGSAFAEQARQQERHAGLVLQFGGGSVQTYCLAFTGESISGLDLLLKTGLDVQYEVYAGMGGEVCKIGREGCDYPQQLCACQSYGPGGVYWSYHHLKYGAWQVSVVGAGTYKVHDGDVEGWAWSDGKRPAARPSFAKVCASALPSPESTAEPTLATRPTTRPTATRQPAATPRPARTPTVAVRATPTRAPKPQATRTPPPPAVPTRPPEVAATATATGAPTTAVPRAATSTGTAAPSPTLTPAVIPTLTFTAIPARTPTPTAASAPGPSPTLVAAAGPAASGDAARTIGILVGLASALGFVVWRGLVAARSRAHGGGDGDAG